jgi:hypothetical protein
VDVYREALAPAQHQQQQQWGQAAGAAAAGQAAGAAPAGPASPASPARWADLERRYQWVAAATAEPGAAGALHQQPLLAAYPPLQRLQQKRLAARRHTTTYCYDFPAVFESALRCGGREGGRAGGAGGALARPWQRR